ncbi:MAG: phosphoribosyltransferase family protein [Sneathiella sp.]
MKHTNGVHTRVLDGLSPPVGWLVQQSFDNCPLVPIKGRKFILNPLTEQIPATSPELLEDAANWIATATDFSAATKIVGEEDKGGILVAATSLKVGLPFGLARWQPSGLEGQVKVDFECEYTSGTLYLNGAEKSDRVIIVDDIISTGGTMISLIKALQKTGCEIVDVICVAEKVDYHGARRVFEETGIRVKCLMQLSMDGETSSVLPMPEADFSLPSTYS